ncbi:phospholipase D-like domain-containing protein [Trueperella pecoris]|uniref:Phosphatidylserine/phosphatidylglycerophosphate/ cardiolipin synthase family protein n=1 Tax=Trueperella pecoris TaxID=2733571 RepID=A0A7M1QWF4_9ACTO|nr:phospholipase D-like domain-containing protein [Trueperella pecoris]QOQ39184.1 phosphatidylserine/phosphatidylglycerophosphate/cardiolipin synthase family protein [Trueperella pecoris]QOR46183.1 phosphatidylserine/phosphatidylglycerophosphate/cardiolipin synthase family protein [Trueperella pecoris]QTG76011.1 phosphatidylserine/phosphatidylglycerophosphate/cardiolipin synthase family protein [Trueperella pecoris]
MSRFPRPNRGTPKKIVQAGIFAALAAQLAAVTAVIAVDEQRKRRDPPTGKFPTMMPRTVEVSGSELTIYTNGNDLYADMLSAINNAKEQIFFETFIIKADDVGTAFRDALIAAARRGVQVHVIIDTFGNLNQDPSFRQFPEHPNLHVILFPLIRTGIFTGNGKDRGFDHRKLIVVDQSVGFVGGYNIGRLYADTWRDTHLRIVGPSVWELENAFVDMWNVYRKANLPELSDRGLARWSSKIVATQNVPAFKSYPVRASYLGAIDRAHSHVYITMGYFIPDAGILHSLTSAARRGVDVRVLIPQFSNHIVADWVGRPYYTDLLKSGVRIFLYRQAMIHAKTMTVDGIWSTVGTTNIDAVSMGGNFEVNVEVFDHDFATVMEEVFALDLTNAHELLAQEWEQRGRLPRIAEKILRPLAPLL